MTTEMYNILQTVAESNDLEIVETTEGMNGYPKACDYALIGFESYDQLERIQGEINDLIKATCADTDEDSDFECTTLECYKRDGWQLWERRNIGSVYDAYDMENVADDETAYYNYEAKDEKTFAENEGLFDRIQDCNSFEEIETVINDVKKLFYAISDLSDNEILVRDSYGNYDVRQKSCMSYYEDTHNYAIGLTIC